MDAQLKLHFVGSIPLGTAENVFRALAATIGDRAGRYPDGETGGRLRFIRWQERVIENNPQFERATDGDLGTGGDGGRFRRGGYRLRAGVGPDDIRFDAPGYADEAIASWRAFEALRAAGTIPAGVRFQVCLPTPMAFVSAFVAREQRAIVEPAYERALRADLDRLFAAVPHDRLAIQWDLAYEVFCHDGGYEGYYDDDLAGSAERTARLCSYIPAGAEAGIHLCYGDAGHKHMIEPRDTGTCVELANLIATRTQRPIAWFHLPVPRDRADDAFFAPLRGLSLRPGTELYLGLIHYTDGMDGAQRRLAAARRHVDDFGIATECGFGRRDPSTVAALLELHARLGDAI
ncbi:MAG: hypothetical protein AB7N54_05300 [Alphaproteobacteria bacterium]